MQDIPSGIAPIIGCRDGEGGRIEPQTHALVGRVFSHAGNHIRAAGGCAGIWRRATGGDGEGQTELAGKNSVHLPSSEKKAIHEGLAVEVSLPRSEGKLVGSIDSYA